MSTAMTVMAGPTARRAISSSTSMPTMLTTRSAAFGKPGRCEIASLKMKR
jgi:hypothetical protein